MSSYRILSEGAGLVLADQIKKTQSSMSTMQEALSRIERLLEGYQPMIIAKTDSDTGEKTFISLMKEE